MKDVTVNNEKERESIKRIAAVYHDSDLGGINLSYHVAVRDAMISEEGASSALELGCGNGLWTSVLCERYPLVDVVDGSPELLAHVACICQEQPATLNCHNVLVEEFQPPQDQKWEHIYLTFLLEHLRDPVSVLEHIRSWLARNGILFVAVPNARSIHRELAVKMGLLETVVALSDNDRRVGHRRVYTSSLLETQLAASGYSILCEKHIGMKPLSLGQMGDYPPALVRALCAAGHLAGKHAAYIGMQAIPASCRVPG